MTFWSMVRLSWQAYKTRRKMNRQFGKREDPFAYATTPYEGARLVAMDEALGPGPLGPVLEVGCAEGISPRSWLTFVPVLAVDISVVALARARSARPKPSSSRPTC